jgi:hypothetical protein
VEDLSDSAEYVVSGEITRLEGRFVDFGGEEPLEIDPKDGEELRPGGLPLALYEVRVTGSVRGDLQAGDTVLVSLLDDEVVESEHVAEVEEGDRFILFLSKLDVDGLVGLETAGRDLYVPLNYSNGLLPVNNGKVVLNRWILGVSRIDAEVRLRQLNTIELERGPEAVELELETNRVEIGVDAVLGTVKEEISPSRQPAPRD